MARTQTPSRLVRVLISLHPPSWRDRYGAEFAIVLHAALAGGGPRWRTVLDVAHGALDAHLHPSLTEGSRPVTTSLRTAASTVFCAFILFVVGGVGFQKITEDPSFSLAARAHTTVAWSYRLVVGGAAVAGIAIVAAALPVAIVIVRQILAGRRDLLRPLVAPPAATGVFLATTVGLARLAGQPGDVHALGNVVLFCVVAALGLATAVIWGSSVVALMRRAEISARALRAQVLSLSMAGLAMASVTVGALVWGVALRSSDAGLFHTDGGILATPLAPSWAVAVAVMAVATAWGWRATTRSLLAVHRRGCAPSA